MNFSENTVRDIEDGSEEIIKSKAEENLGMTMNIGNIVEMDGRQLSDFEEENTWKLVKNTINNIRHSKNYQSLWFLLSLGTFSYIK